MTKGTPTYDQILHDHFGVLETLASLSHPDNKAPASLSVAIVEALTEYRIAWNRYVSELESMQHFTAAALKFIEARQEPYDTLFIPETNLRALTNTVEIHRKHVTTLLSLYKQAVGDR